jgi:hypothetical protein
MHAPSTRPLASRIGSWMSTWNTRDSQEAPPAPHSDLAAASNGPTPAKGPTTPGTASSTRRTARRPALVDASQTPALAPEQRIGSFRRQAPGPEPFQDWPGPGVSFRKQPPNLKSLGGRPATAGARGICRLSATCNPNHLPADGLSRSAWASPFAQHGLYIPVRRGQRNGRLVPKQAAPQPESRGAGRPSPPDLPP